MKDHNYDGGEDMYDHDEYGDNVMMMFKMIMMMMSMTMIAAYDIDDVGNEADDDNDDYVNGEYCC